MTSFRRHWALVSSILLLLLQAVPGSFHYTYAETNGSLDEQILTSFQPDNPDYLVPTNTAVLPENPPETSQQFSFLEKTFRTSAGQPVILQFSSSLAADEVLVRIPENGQIMESLFSNGETIRHSHGEYWLVQTLKEQTTFELPVVFNVPGKYFLTIDRDSDHFYLEVDDVDHEISGGSSQSLKESDITDERIDQRKMAEDNAKILEELPNDPSTVKPVMVKEENLNLSEEIIQAEEERLLETTRDSQARSSSNPHNWSTFRAAWNDSRTTEIILSSSITFSSSILGSSLNTRSTSVKITATSFADILSFSGSNNNLEMSGTATLSINSLSTYPGTNTIPTIKHNGSGLVDIDSISTTYAANGTIIDAQNINLKGRIVIASGFPRPAIIVSRGGTLTITPDLNRGYISSSSADSNSNIKPIQSDASSTIILNTDRITMAAGLRGARTSWYKVNATLTGVNGAQVVSSESDPNDFAERYTENFNTRWYSTLIFNGDPGEFVPPVQEGTVIAKYANRDGDELAESEILTGEVGTNYSTQPKEIDGWTLIEVPDNANGDFTEESIIVDYIYQLTKRRLSLQASPAEGGSPKADEEMLNEQETTTIYANPNEGYRFASWEILSGTGASIADETAETTTFTMGDSDVVLKAIYEEEPTIVYPVDPLDPEKEVNPENPPEIPEDQGALSIDFVSRFAFGEQGISTQTKNYYAQSQRLLNPDGTINEAEERPNYIQISDRRAENDRHGWQLAVTQNAQFTSLDDHELAGARLHLTNQQFATAQGGVEPILSHQEGVALIPGQTTELITAKDEQGTGTWIYRFGDGTSAGESVALEVPPTAAPRATTYQTTLTWELSAVPENE